MKSLERLTYPTTPLVDLANAKLHLHVIENFEDELIADYLLAAEAMIEQESLRSFQLSIWKMTLDRFQPRIYLPRPPLKEVTSIKYRSAGEWVTLDESAYKVFTAGSPGMVMPVSSWPSHDGGEAVIEIEYKAGHEDTSKVSRVARQAIRMLAGTWHRNRENIVIGASINELPEGVDRIVNLIRFRLPTILSQEP